MSGTNWIWLKKWTPEMKEKPVLVLFRRNVEISGAVQEAKVRISADSRYKLYVNGRLAEVGPSKGDRQVWFADTVSIRDVLTMGTNIIAVEVLRYPTDHNKGNHGIFRTSTPGLYLSGTIVYKDGHAASICADADWKAAQDTGFEIVPESKIFAPLQIYENKKGSAKLHGWKDPGFDDSSWENALPYESMPLATSPGNLLPRTIPFMYRKDRIFSDISAIRKSAFDKDQWLSFLHGETRLTIPAGTKEIVEVSAGEEMTGYLHLMMEKGTGSRITLLQSEGYVQDGWYGEELPVKGDRRDAQKGYLYGFTDHYTVSGAGSEDSPEIYEPFWFRTFRYIQLTIETGSEPLTLSGFSYTETGYPLEVRTKAETDDPSLKQIWGISQRTLQRCMHETYEDCPFYEQLQYAMDSRSQILYTYSVSGDDRLARKCMDDFRRSQRYDGLLNCSYPNYETNVIPTFSIFYILMLYDHMMYFGDKELLEDHMPTVEGILRFFHRHKDSRRLVGTIGGLNNGKDRFWSFIDWTPEWDATTGVPDAVLQGPVTMESLLYVYGLQHAAAICDWLGRKEQAEEFRQEANHIQQAVREYCSDTNGVLTDGPGYPKYSQHVQVFAILTDTIPAEEGKLILEKTILHKKDYAQCSVAMAFYLFRALEKTGLYRYTDQYWDIWRDMIRNGATTCVENNVTQRSDCHAWGSLILYELPSAILGVRPSKPGYAAVRIHPVAGYLHEAKGDVITPKGMIHVEWKKAEGDADASLPIASSAQTRGARDKDDSGRMELHYSVPEGLCVEK